ncbi:putative transmembrane metalloendopeptidase protein [Bordetella holmesii 44057]|nr:putative transmembrane metalloendopeptidase protein [Bordetella holmesii 44057]
MHARAGQDRHFTVGGGRLALLMGLALLAAAVFGAGMQRLLFGASASPYTVDWPSYARSQANRDADFMRENVNMLASKVGMLQAKLVSIDGLGRRVAEIAGLQYTGAEAAAPAAPLDEATHVMDDLFTDRQPPTPESAEALGRQLDDIQARLAEQADNLKLLDAALTSHSAEQARVPTAMPIRDYPYLSSSYGWRRNPVTGGTPCMKGWTSPPRRARPFWRRRAAWCC